MATHLPLEIISLSIRYVTQETFTIRSEILGWILIPVEAGKLIRTEITIKGLNEETTVHIWIRTNRTNTIASKRASRIYRKFLILYGIITSIIKEATSLIPTPSLARG